MPLHPALAIPFVISFALACGCVSQARHDDVKSQLERTTEARDGGKRRAAELEVQATELAAALEALQAEMATSEAALQKEREQLAQVRFEVDVIGRERQEARRMSEQLLVELERVAAHLRAFADDKRLLDEQRGALATELDAAKQRLEALALDEKANQQRFKAARELTLAFAEPLEKNELRLTLVDGNIAIQFPYETVFDSDGAELSQSGRDLLQAAATVLAPLDLEVQVEQPTAGEAQAERARSVSEALVTFGLAPERVLAQHLEPTPAKAGSSAELDDGASEPGERTDDATEPARPTLAKAPESARAGDTELELRLRFANSKS